MEIVSILQCKFSILAFFFCVSTFSIYGQEIDSVKVITYRLKGRTATGQHTYKIKVPFIAVSRDLLKIFPLHSVVELYACPWAGKYHVLDIMGKRHTKTIDLFYKGRKKIQVTCCCRKAEKS